MILKTVQQILSRSDRLKWESIPFPTPLHFQLDYVYTIDEDAGLFTVTQWTSVEGTLYPGVRQATLASIRETSLSTLVTLLDDGVAVSESADHLQSDLNDATDVQKLLNSFGITPRIPAQLNELQFQLFTDFVFTWRFYFDNISTWERSFPLFAALAIGLLRIAAWDFEVRGKDIEDLPITFSSLPAWKAPADDIFWFHKYLIVFCNTDQIGTSLAAKAKRFISHGNIHTKPVHGIAISIRHIELFEICNGDITHSPPIPLNIGLYIHFKSLEGTFSFR
ncbi:hypothetical protein N7457_007902 [Penicillium paradoxum]|uniref:uncharacterized protein n=1 Tax=Penicillium paradoxum TaxID=176176 RepID=UPI0025481C9C|nr:uncharacterized protein N7457_007902 [Penicillium paradoxum]KAJ5773006.1 hypothetical protein N7457_007902 [Penicillium paradoxum]